VELYRAAAPTDLAEGFLKARTGPAVLDLGGAGGQVIDMVHSRPDLHDKHVRLLTQPLTLRWTALVRHDAGQPSMDFLRFHDGRVHISAVTGAEHVAGLVRFCEDVALHQWLLSTITDVLRGAASGDDLDDLGPALEYLGHLWSPGESGDDDLAYLWQSIEERYHLTRGWQNQLGRVRDQVLLRTYRLVKQTIEPDRPWP
jgi:hypothetical protein